MSSPKGRASLYTDMGKKEGKGREGKRERRKKEVYKSKSSQNKINRESRFYIQVR